MSHFFDNIASAGPYLQGIVSNIEFSLWWKFYLFIFESTSFILLFQRTTQKRWQQKWKKDCFILLIVEWTNIHAHYYIRGCSCDLSKLFFICTSHRFNTACLWKVCCKPNLLWSSRILLHSVLEVLMVSLGMGRGIFDYQLFNLNSITTIKKSITFS